MYIIDTSSTSWTTSLWKHTVSPTLPPIINKQYVHILYFRKFNLSMQEKICMCLSTGGLWRPTHDRESREMVPYWNSVSWVLLRAAWPAWYIPQSGTYSGLDLLHYKFYLKLTPNLNWVWSPQQYWLCHIFIIHKQGTQRTKQSEGEPMNHTEECFFLLT